MTWNASHGNFAAKRLQRNDIAFVRRFQNQTESGLQTVKIRALAVAALLAATAAIAAETPAGTPLDARNDNLVRQSVPVCSDLKITQSEFPPKMPTGITASVVRVDSARAACQGQYIMATTSSGGFYLGLPWILAETEGKTIEEKLKNFTWTNMQETFTPTVDRANRTPYGLYPVTLLQTTERGKVPIEGEVDPEGKIFFMGHFRNGSTDMAAARIKTFAPFVADAPARGAAKPEVTVVEFSDFECPSCKHASTYVDSVIAKYGEHVRYVRYDLPLVGNHPWAFAAAAAGRAIYRQKPDLFWDYKKQVYANQDKLSAFTIDDFARGFAQDHELDMKRYDADLMSEQLRDELLKGVGAAFSNDVRATPTYMINGVYVDPGDDGKPLETYVANLLKK